MTAQPKRQISAHAAAAKAIKGYAKALGIDCKARSDSYSMGSSVHWSVTDVHPLKFKVIETLADQHEYWSFDGMQDLYEYTNRRDDLPQVKFVFGKCEYSADMYQAAYDWLRAKAPANAKPIPADYESAQKWNWYTGTNTGFVQHHEEVRHYVYAILSGGSDGNLYDWRGFWNQVEGVPDMTDAQLLAALAEPSDNATEQQGAPLVRIEKHTHTKKGFEMFVCPIPSRVDRSEFDKLLATARELGGWYSRAWGTTPGGFAFKRVAEATVFAIKCGWSSLTDHAPQLTAVKAEKASEPSPTPKPKKTAVSVTAEQLREQAARLHKNAAACFADRLTNTPKRLGQAMHKRLEGQRDERTARALERLADNLDAGEQLPAWLDGKKAPQVCATLAGLLRYKLEPCRNGYHGYSVESATPEHDSAESRAAFALLDDAKEAARQAESELKQKIEALRFSRIPGYFPTPAPVVARMLERIEQDAPARMLEPSAGSGNIADALRTAYPTAALDCLEINHSLRDILAAKGHTLAGSDFLAHDQGGYDLIVMNPPFENLQDAAHVMHAFSLLAGGGELVSIMSPSVFFREDSNGLAFRTWFDRFGGVVEHLPDGSFKQSGTGVNTVLIYMWKPL